MKLLQQSEYLWVNDGFFKRLIRKLYWKYVNDLYIPRGNQKIRVTRYPKVHKKLYGEISCISVKINEQEACFFNDFGNEFYEQEKEI